jgi:LTXXQ motif family protein
MIMQIEQRVRSSKDQGASLNNLRKVSANMAKLLTGSCAQPIPADPLARLDAADEQLTTMNYAATTVQIAFDDFYGWLDDQQKARLNSAGR